jgi:hypothetical protein
MSHMYLTLPSNSSTNYYPDNTLTHYVTKLHSAMNLSGEWEVALSEIHFPRSWYTIEKTGATFTAECTLPWRGTALSPLIPLNAVDASIQTPQMREYSLEMKLQGGYYENMQDLVKELNAVMTKEFADLSQKNLHEFIPPKIRYSELNKRTYFTIPKGIVLKFHPSLMTILGLKHSQMDNKSGDLKAVRSVNVSDINAGIHSLYVYCDLLEYVPVGDTLAPLLRVVDTQGRNGDMQHRIYEPPRYIPLQKKNFDSVEIDIRDDLGQPISFESGKLSVTLHLRRATSPYFI